jgi:hypothetical protein
MSYIVEFASLISFILLIYLGFVHPMNLIGSNTIFIPIVLIGSKYIYAALLLAAVVVLFREPVLEGITTYESPIDKVENNNSSSSSTTKCPSIKGSDFQVNLKCLKERKLFAQFKNNVQNFRNNLHKKNASNWLEAKKTIKKLEKMYAPGKNNNACRKALINNGIIDGKGNLIMSGDRVSHEDQLRSNSSSDPSSTSTSGTTSTNSK